MSIYGIGDLHLSLSKNKTMDKFGENWRGHVAKIKSNWESVVTPEDTVLIAGDISWAMYLKDAQADLNFIESLPGKKILLCGNHDYWWDSVSKIRNSFPALSFIQNDSVMVDDYWICGTRGWIYPSDSKFTQSDMKIYNRELTRLRLSLDDAMKQGATKILLLFHFPPSNAQHDSTAFLEILKQYPVTDVVYGHLHGEEAFLTAIIGEMDGIQYHLVSADYVQFKPKKIM